jgi:hypothetical protein
MYDDLDRAAGNIKPVTPGQRPPPVAHLSRNPGVSIFQSILHHCVNARLDELTEKLEPGESPVAEWALAENDLFKKFGPCDPLWIETKLAEGLALLRDRPAFPDKPPPSVTMADRARIVIVGDWATGLPQAVKVAEQMRAVIEQGRRDGIEQRVIHLGDTYYSGWSEEYESRFLPHWPVSPGESDVSCWTLNGNHDMYSGGHGYFGTVLRDARFGAQQETSHFAIQSSAWQILGLDSAYKNHDLAGHQAEWLGQMATDPQRKTMVLSHHQPFSGYEHVEAPLEATVKRGLAGRRVEAWLWGHEHRCAVYERDLVDYAQFTSIVGHGGVPLMLSADPTTTPAGVSWQFDGTYEFEDDRWALFGFAVLDFDGSSVQVRYIDENGLLNHTEQLD